MSGVEDAVIQGHLRSLRLPGIRSEYPSLIREAKRDNWSFEMFHRELLEKKSYHLLI